MSRGNPSRPSSAKKIEKANPPSVSKLQAFLPNSTKICPGCNDRIEGTWYFALSNYWHQDHFRCVYCNTLLSGQTFHSKDNRPYCKKDFVNLFGTKCRNCGKKVDGPFIYALDDYWHPEHFTCSICERRLDVDKFSERNNTPYCKDCFETDLTIYCDGCGLPITDIIFKGMEKTWHQNCFKCSKCLKPIEDEYVVLDEKPSCRKCLPIKNK